MGGVALCQIVLGGAAWVTKFGLPSVGYVAVQRSPLQIAVRTSHTVVGMLLLMTSVILLFRVLRVASTLRVAQRPIERPLPPLPVASLKGGLS